MQKSKESTSNTQKKPRVSVCIPNYNFAHLIGQTIQSILTQTFKDFEIVIVDDDSTDDSLSVIQSFSDERIRIYRNEKNIGRVKNIKKTLELAEGDYITILPSDNTLYVKNSLEKRVELLDLNPEVHLVFSGKIVTDEAGKIIYENRPFHTDYIAEGEDEFKRIMSGGNIPTPTVMVRRECYDNLGTFNEDVTGCSDREMWIRVALNGSKIAYINNFLVRDYEHQKDISNYYIPTNLWGMNKYRMIMHVFSHIPEKKKHLFPVKDLAIKTLAKEMLTYAVNNSRLGRNNLARKNIGLAIAIDDRLLKSWRTHFFLFLTFLGKWVWIITKMQSVRDFLRHFLFKKK